MEKLFAVTRPYIKSLRGRFSNNRRYIHNTNAVCSAEPSQPLVKTEIPGPRSRAWLDKLNKIQVRIIKPI